MSNYLPVSISTGDGADVSDGARPTDGVVGTVGAVCADGAQEIDTSNTPIITANLFISSLPFTNLISL